MKRDTVVFSVCSFLLGLVIGGLLIGPHFARVSPAAQSATAADGGPPQGGPPAANAMEGVREQLASLKQTVERDPKNFDALAQLGSMYMDAAKYPQAIGYFERALSVREDPSLRTDLGICYKQNKQLDDALAAFRRASDEAPGEWQPLFNEAVLLGEMQKFTEANALVPRLQKLRPGDADVQRLAQALAARSLN